MRTRLFVVAVLTALVPACASHVEGSESTETNLSEGELDPALYGSWSIDDGTINSAAVRDKAFRTVAGLILRSDGTYFAQLAPREVTTAPFVDESHLAEFRDKGEVAGNWQ